MTTFERELIEQLTRIADALEGKPHDMTSYDLLVAERKQIAAYLGAVERAS